MSRSIIACPKCKEPVAVKHHSGRIVVRDGVKVAIVANEIELRCSCGAVRVVTPEKRAA